MYLWKKLLIYFSLNFQTLVIKITRKLSKEIESTTSPCLCTSAVTVLCFKIPLHCLFAATDSTAVELLSESTIINAIIRKKEEKIKWNKKLIESTNTNSDAFYWMLKREISFLRLRNIFVGATYRLTGSWLRGYCDLWEWVNRFFSECCRYIRTQHRCLDSCTVNMGGISWILDIQRDFTELSGVLINPNFNSYDIRLAQKSFNLARPLFAAEADASFIRPSVYK